MSFDNNLGSAFVEVNLRLNDAQATAQAQAVVAKLEKQLKPIALRVTLNTSTLTAEVNKAATTIQTRLAAAFKTVEKSAATTATATTKTITTAAQKSAATLKTTLGPTVFTPLVVGAEAAGTALSTSMRAAAVASNQALSTVGATASATAAQVTTVSRAAAAAANTTATSVNSRLGPAFAKIDTLAKNITDNIQKGLGGVGTKIEDTLTKPAKLAIKDLDHLTERTRGLNQGLSRLGKGLLNLLPSFQTLIKVIGAAGLAIVAFSLRSFAQFQSATASIEVLLRGSTITLNEFVSGIERLATKTPFAVSGLLDLSKQLLAIQIPAQQVTPILTLLADAGALFGASGPDISNAVRALGQLRSTSRPLVQDLRQISTAFVGFNAEWELAQGLAEKGLTIDSVTGAQAFDIILERLAKFNGLQGAAERQSKTLSGALSNLFDRIGIAARNAFAPLGETLSKIIPDIAIKLEDAFKQIAPPLADLAEHLLPLLVDTIIDAAPGIANFIKALTEGLKNAAPLIEEVIESFNALALLMREITELADDIFKSTPEREKFKEEMRDIARGVEPELKRAGKRWVEIVKAPFEALSTTIVTKTTEEIQEILGNVTTASQAYASATRSVRDAQERLNDVLQRGRVDEEAVARAIEQHKDATDRVTDALRNRTEAELALAEARSPATEEELGEAADRLTRAQIDLARAIRERDAAEKQLTQTQRTSLNLQGLSLDQLRSTLANVRAQLNAQRATKKGQEDAAKSAEELAEDATLREIQVRDAKRDVIDAEQALQLVKAKGLETDEKVIDARIKLKDAEDNVTDALKAQTTAQEALRKEKQGSLDFDRQIRDANEAVADALERQQAAQTALAAARATALDDHEALNRLKIQELTLNGQLIAQNPALFQSFVTTLLGSLTAGLPSSGGPGAPGLQNRANLITKLFEALSRPGSDLAAIFHELGVAGFAAGGLVTAPTIARIGERFKPELILPLSRPDRAWQLLSDSLPKMPASLRARVEAGVTPSRPTVATFKRPTAVSSNTRQDNRELAEMIAEELHKKGIASENLSINVTAPTTDPVKLAGHLARLEERRRNRRR